MRRILILCLFSIWVLGLNAQKDDFKHPWEMKYLENDIQFISKKKAPIPFSMTGEPEATITVGASKVDNSTKNDLSKIVKEEIEGIRNEVSLAEYLEDDYKPNNDIVTYYDKVKDVKIAVIKYRVNGLKGGQKILPRSTRQILFLHNNKLWISSLIVLYGEDQENIRSDQMSFIKSIIDRK